MVTKNSLSFSDEMKQFHEKINPRLHHLLGSKLTKSKGVAGAEFKVWAPNAQEVRVVGEFNKWNGKKHLMKFDPFQGIWSIFIPGLKEGDIYKYEILPKKGKKFLKSDPFAFFSELRPNTASVIKDVLSEYPWEDSEWLEKRAEWNSYEKPMNIYELHLGSWKKRPVEKEEGKEKEEDGRGFYTYREIAKKLIPYIQEMGYTHIEVMPLAEHPLDASWGYQVTGYFSMTSRYGEPEDFKYFVNELHKAGIGIIMDWVPGHFCKDSHGLYRFDGTPLYEYEDDRRGENYGWGTANFNLGSPEVRSFLVSNAVFLYEVYHIDGIRADAISNVIYMEYGKPEIHGLKNKYGGDEDLEAIEFLRELNKTVFEYFKNPLMIAEEATAWPLVTRPSYIGGLGFNYKWNMGWMNDMLKYMELDPIYRKYNHNLITFSLMYSFSENFILSLSHDEVVHGKKSLLDKMFGHYENKFASLRMFYGYMYTHPGKKLLFMGGEFGQFIEWRFYEELEWKLLKYPIHDSMKSYVRDLNHLYKREKALWELDCTSDGFQWIDHNNADQSIISYVRKSRDKDDYLVIICNFTPVRYSNFKVGIPRITDYEEIFNSDRDIYGGSNVRNMGIIKPLTEEKHGMPYSVSLEIPPLSTIILKPKFASKNGNFSKLIK